ILGVYGVSALVASVSAVAAVWATSPVSASRWRPALGVAAAIGCVAVWGSLRAASAELTRLGEPVRVGLIQGNIEQAEKIEAARADDIFNAYLRMTRQAIGYGAQLVVWPESATPFMFEEDAAGAGRVRAIAREARVPILLGS